MKIEIIKCLQDNYSYLIIDEENQTELTDGRIEAWVAKLKTTLGL